MSSKYKNKLGKPITKQSNALIPNFYPECTNCGNKSALINPQYSKCYCGGTFQLYGAKK